MKNFLKTLSSSLILLSFTMLFSCEPSPRKVNVKIDNEFVKNNKVILDDSIRIPFYKTDNEFANMVLMSGEHHVSVNDGPKMPFTVGIDGGILNVSRRDFVIYSIKYEMGNPNPLAGLLGNNVDIPEELAAQLNSTVVEYEVPLLVDGYVVYNKTLAESQEDLKKVLKTKSKSKFDTHLVFVPAAELFIHKTWDFDIHETAPEQVEMRVEEGQRYAKTYRSSIMEATTFPLYAMFSGEYNVEKITDEELASTIGNW
ncbi:hypothetical protein [Sediminitomix flava]|uniref:Uncharacterized protein n=1 Tax=Sediminitomix flava TaxID=379075 RepID=A0A315YYZ8_SEDFL|nr:hypothetical protein [Sediminitomix flava]PWJ34128.1 hypothetical protein BC781_11138 [Sediminitomix flava]